MITLKNILVATDFSEPATVATDYGQELARSYGATLHVLHVIQDILEMYAFDLGAALPTVQQNIAEAAQRSLASLTASRGDAVRTAIVRSANVSNAITQYAKENDIDLIVVGTHGRGAVSRFLIGSVAERVVRTAPCPVLTVHAGERDFADLQQRVVDEGAADRQPTTLNH